MPQSKNKFVHPPTVYIPFNDGTKNLHPATSFGQFCTFTRHELPTDEQGIVELTDSCYTWISSFDHQKDALLLVGDPVLISMVSALTATICPWYTVLKWDRQTRSYIKIRINVERPND